jgi:hypothetical protein
MWSVFVWERPERLRRLRAESECRLAGQGHAIPHAERGSHAVRDDHERGEQHTRPRGTDPWHVIFADPALLRDHHNLAATYGRTVILHRPVEFIADTIPLLFDSLRATDSKRPIVANGPFSGVLLALQALAALAQYTLLLFPFIVIAWWGRLIYLFRFRLRRPDTLTVAMAGLSLICAYDLAITTLSVYTQYSRMNAPIDPLMLIVVWGTIISVGSRLARRFSRRHEGAVVQTAGEADNARLASV